MNSHSSHSQTLLESRSVAGLDWQCVQNRPLGATPKNLTSQCKNLMLAGLFFLMILTSAKAVIIQSSNRVDWTEGVTVGVQGGIPWRTTIFTNFYVTNTSAEINAGIAACPSNQVVMLNQEGVFNVSAGLTIDKDGVSLRGLGSNTILYGTIQAGPSISGNSYEFSITNGGAKGTTNLVLNSLTDQFGSALAPGDALYVSADFFSTNSQFQYISLGGFNKILKQMVVIHSINSSTVSISAPLIWDFTNNPTLTTVNLPGIPVARPRRMIGLENLTLTITNAGSVLPAGRTLSMTMLQNSWVTNCNILYGNNYNFYFQYNVNCTVIHNQMRYSLGEGSNHAGWLLANDTGCLFVDNIIADGLTPAIEFNDGFVGNAIVANFETNNILSIDCHNSHPAMNLWEANVFAFFVMDGYFGSASHQTLFRNRSLGTIAFKRFNTFMQVVGNVLGSPAYDFDYTAAEVSGYPVYGIFELGFPNIGNTSFEGISPPTAWNWPGTNFTITDNVRTTNYLNGAISFTNTQGPTNILYGNFTNNTPSMEIWGNACPSIAFQNSANTNLYYYGNGLGMKVLTNFGNRVVLSQSVTVSNGWKLYYIFPQMYQQLQTLNKATHTLHGNAVCTNQTDYTLVWDSAVADHTIPNSLIYNSAPGWWGTNRWPAINPEATVMAAPIPAQLRYAGFNVGGGEPASPVIRILNVNRVTVGRVQAP
jgi:hypothetical protein